MQCRIMFLRCLKMFQQALKFLNAVQEHLTAPNNASVQCSQGEKRPCDPIITANAQNTPLVSLNWYTRQVSRQG